MQIRNNKRIWLFVMLTVMALTTVCLWNMGNREKKVYANGKMVELIREKHVDSCDRVNEWTILWGKA